jgi:hypothetical protein
MKKLLIWTLAVLVTLVAAYYQRKTGPTYPKRIDIKVNGTDYEVKLTRSLGLDERSEVKLAIPDTSVKATLYYKRFRTEDQYTAVPFAYKVYPVDSYVMNKLFDMTEESGLFASLPQQPPAGKLQYYIELESQEGLVKLPAEEPLVVRYKDRVPAGVLLPHVLIMFLAMLWSTAAGLMAAFSIPSYKRTALFAFIFLLAGGMILGPVVQKYAFGELWTGIPFGWDLTDNKTLIAFLAWLAAVLVNRKSDRPWVTVLASFLLLAVYSIPHSMFGSELDYTTGQVTQGILLIFLFKWRKKS